MKNDESVNASMFAVNTSGGMPIFQPDCHKFEDWIDLLEVHFLENGVTEDDKMISILIKAVGINTYGLLKQLCHPILPYKKKYTELIEMLKQQFGQRTVVFFERKVFFAANKSDSESVNNWYARCRKLATNCEFGSLLDSFLVSKFVTGLSGKIFEALCEEDEKLTLANALKKSINSRSKIRIDQASATTTKIHTTSWRIERSSFCETWCD